jgi:hypothetical protein
VLLANSIGYAPSGLINALMKLSDRNKDAKEPNGMFASHPLLTERIAKIESMIKSRKLAAAATVEARYGKNITFDARPATAIATVAEGSRGLAGGDGKKAPEKAADAASPKADAAKPKADAAKPKADAAKTEEPKKSGGMLSRLRPGGGKQAEQSQTVASAGARGVNPDRDAVGGPNKKRVPVKIGPTDIAEFRKGIA